MKLLSWGANSQGQTGLGFVSESVLCPKPVDLGQDLLISNIKSICGGGSFSLILTDNGLVYSVGCNDKNQLGFESDTITFKRISALERDDIWKVASGWDFSCAITSNKTVRVWGSNEYKQLGLPDKVKTTKPAKLEISNVRDVACGLRHMLLVLANGDVMATGNNSHDQLGIKSDLKNCKLEVVPDLKNVARVACGQYHNLALCSDGSVYSWGSNRFGQTGSDPKQNLSQKIPQKLDLDVKVSDISCGWSHSVILDTKDRLYTFGRNSYGQLGTNRVETWRPEVLPTDYIGQVVAGSEHNIAITTTNVLLTWGWNEHGNCGNNDEKLRNVLAPTEIMLPNPAYYIASGAAHSFVVA